MNPKFSRMLLVGIVSLGIGIGYAYYLYQKPRPSAHSVKTNLRMTASVLYQEFLKDDSLANGKFLGKMIKVSGRIKEIDSTGGDLTLYLETGGNGLINCAMAAGESVKPGINQVAVKGQCTGFMEDVLMADCILIEE